MSEFRLNASLEIRDVEAERMRLLAALDACTRLRVDVTPVIAVDTAGVQLLISLQREARRRAVALEFVGQSSALEQVAADLGLPTFERAA